MVDATLQDLRGITVIILIATIVVVIAAYLWGRPRWVVATTSYVSDTAGHAGSAAGATAAGVAGSAPDRVTIEKTVRENRSLVERFGLAIIVFFLVWIAIGLEVALLGAALVIGFELVLRALGGPSDDEADDIAAAEVAVIATETPVVPPAPVEAAPLTPAPPAAADATERVATATPKPKPKQPPKASSAAASKTAAAAKPPAKKPARTAPPPKPKPPTG